MACKLNNHWWILTKKQLEAIHLQDAVWREEAVEIKNRQFANFQLGEWYVRYAVLLKKMDEILDQMVQPQKRVTVKKLVDAIAIRLMDFNDAFRDLDFSEFHYVDGNIVERKIIPHDIEIVNPHLFQRRPDNIEDMWTRIKKGERIYLTPEEVEAEKERVRKESEAALSKRRRPRPGTTVVKLAPEILAKLAKFTQAVTLIQTAERARQERIFYKIKLKILTDSRKARALAIAKALGQLKDVETQTEEEIMMIQTAAAIIIQSYWRGFRARAQRKYDEVQRRIVIGMYEPYWRSKEEFECLEDALKKRRKYRDQRFNEYVAALEKEKVRVLKYVAPKIMEDIGDEIREWFHAWYEQCDMFDDFPTEMLGGTCLVVRGETLTPQEYLTKKAEEKAMGPKALKALKKEEKEAAKLAKFLEKQKIKAAEKAKKKMAKQRRAEQAALLPHQYKYYHDPPNNIELFNEGIQEHKILWDERSELKNPQEKHYLDIITADLCYESQVECRKIIDQLMRLELSVLQQAYATDNGKKFKPPPVKKPKKEKKKKSKDMTADKLTEELFQELVDNGVIRNYPKASLSSFHGDFGYHNWELTENDLEIDPTLLDIRQTIVMNIILPMGVTVMKRPKSVLISGPKQMGKHLLANSIFNATKCIVFDLSPEVTAEIYLGKEVKMLVHLVKKMAKILAPSIIFIDNAEKLFWKKVPKEEKQNNPKRLGKCLKELISGIKDEDRVMILGLSSAPFEAKNDIKKIFERHILIPSTEQNSLYKYWSEILLGNPSIDRNIDITLLARVTLGYPLPALRGALKDLLHVRRVLNLKNNPLTATEIFKFLLNNDVKKVTEKEWAEFMKWFKGLPYSKKRAKYLRSAKEEREANLF